MLGFTKDSKVEIQSPFAAKHVVFVFSQRERDIQASL